MDFASCARKRPRQSPVAAKQPRICRNRLVSYRLSRSRKKKKLKYYVQSEKYSHTRHMPLESLETSRVRFYPDLYRDDTSALATFVVRQLVTPIQRRK